MDKFIKKITGLIGEVKSVIKKEKEEKQKRRLIVVLTVFIVALLFFALIAVPIYAYETIYQIKVYPGVYVEGINISGLTKEQAIDKLNQHVDNLKDRGLNFRYKNQKLNVGLTVVSPEDPDLAFPILAFNNEKMVEAAFSVGRDNNLRINLFNQLHALLNKKEIKLDYKLNEPELIKVLKDRYQEFEEPSENAQISFAPDGKIIIIQEKNGFEINYDKSIKQLKNNLNLISINSIDFETVRSIAKVTKPEAESQQVLITQALQTPMITLGYDDKKWEIKKEEFQNWLGFAKENGSMVLEFTEEKIQPKFDELGQEINFIAQNAKFVFADGKVTEFQPGKVGLELNTQTSRIKINQEFFNSQQVEIQLNVDETEPLVKTADVNDMGIKELVGVGQSDFAGSSNNRIKNIQNAANHLNGILIKPDEEFSLVEAIGAVTAATGYFPEYVIKGDRTIQEYGGGLCQIATTVFRAALYSGVEISERKNHSYMVSYYYPNGMDATIYGPHPDLRFINDSGNNILVQTRIEGTYIYFEFWGTSDGRQVEITDPETYNWRGAGEPRYIENPNLAPGAKRLLEHSRRGADAHFYRYITRPGQTEKEEEIWRSHYGAWKAIYEIGPAVLVEEEPTDVVTEENINQPVE